MVPFVLPRLCPQKCRVGCAHRDRWTEISRYEDLLAADLVAVSSYVYDGMGRLTALTHAQALTTLADYDWAYDAASRVTQFDSLTDGTATYSSDNANQLTSADYDYQTDESFAYDVNGNRTMTGYDTGDNNQLLSDGVYDYTYDNEGNRLTRTKIATGIVDEYEWDYHNRLVNSTTRSSATGPATQIVDYIYDLCGRRLAKLIDTDGDTDYDEETHYILDGERHERGHAGDHIVLTFNANGDLTNRYLHGPAVDQVLADEQIDDVLGTTVAGEVLWPLTDNLSTVRDIADFDSMTDTTTVVNHITYGVYGVITAETNSTIKHLPERNPLRNNTLFFSRRNTFLRNGLPIPRPSWSPAVERNPLRTSAVSS